jgi:inorganic phosphate transporter, PiT family
MSTTQVSTGAIAGVTGADTARLNPSALWRLLLGWTLTPAVAGGLAAGTLIAGQNL